jgi:hypothetical protein
MATTDQPAFQSAEPLGDMLSPEQRFEAITEILATMILSHLKDHRENTKPQIE